MSFAAIMKGSKSDDLMKRKIFLALLSQRLIGELIVYPCSGVVVVAVVHHLQTSSPPKPLGQSKSNFMWSLLGKGEPKFV